MHGETGILLKKHVLNLVAKLGENVQVRRIMLDNPSLLAVGTYLHGNRIGVIVELDVDNKELARDIAMHIAASKPIVDFT